MSRKPHVRSVRVFRLPQAALFSDDLYDRAEADRLAPWTLDVVNRLDLAALRESYEDHGGVAYDPARLLAVLFLGYSVGVTSARKLDEHCRFDARFALVAGGQTPDYVTLARFRRRVAQFIEGLFVQVVRLAIEEGMVKLGSVSLDSTKVASAGSQAKRCMAKAMEEDGVEEPYSDPEAAVFKTRKATLRGYCVQAVVDAETGVVVAAEVTLEANDRHSAPRMLERVAEATGLFPDALLADKGYDSHRTYSACESAGVEAFVPPQDHAPLFWSDGGDGVLRCPLGSSLVLTGHKKSHGVDSDVYQAEGCAHCMLRASCNPCGKARTSVVPAGTDPALRVQAATRMKGPAGRLAMWDRQSTVEPAFGDLKVEHERRQARSTRKGRGDRGDPVEVQRQEPQKGVQESRRTSFQPVFCSFSRL